MINKHGKAEIVDAENHTNLFFEVNFDEKYKDCVKITIAGHSGIVNYSDLFSFMFILASKEQRAKMVPVREELGHQYMKQIQVKLKKDMKEGDYLVVNVPINVPQIVEDAILEEKGLSTPTPYLTEPNDKV